MKKVFKKREKPYFQALFPKTLDCYFLQITNSQPDVKKEKSEALISRKSANTQTNKQTYRHHSFHIYFVLAWVQK